MTQPCREAFHIRLDLERAMRVVDLARDNAIYPATGNFANVDLLEDNAEMIESLLTGAVMMLQKTLADLQALESGQERHKVSPSGPIPFGL
jgi:hypothetical protein